MKLTPLAAAAVIMASPLAAYAADTATTAPAASAQTGMNGDLFVSTANGDQLASRLIGAAVYGSDGKSSIGTVKDLVIGNDGAIQALLVDANGKTVAVNFDSIQWSKDQAHTAMVPGLTPDQLNTAPAFDTAALDAGMMPNAADNAMTGDKTAQAVKPAAGAMTNGNTQTADQMQQVDLAKISANDLINTTVYSAQNENLGEVGDVILNKDGKIDAVVLDIGGFLGIGEKPVAIAFDGLDIRTDQNGAMYVYTRFTRDELQNAPDYNKDTYAAQRDTMRLTVQ